MNDLLKQHIKKLIIISDSALEEVDQFVKTQRLAKKENVVTAGQVCKANYFVASGCLRMFFIDDKGVEKTVQFAIENWWLADYTSFHSQKPSEFCIQAVEKSEIIALDFAAQEELLKKLPALERYFWLIHQRAHAASQYRMKFHYDYSKEEMYRNFVREFPKFSQRVPQYLLASYLGLTPEYLSELRARDIS
jgi:CRP/FNR family transcriptional regulator, anaerobic regulatory protein